jgi:hypothetical protein
MWKRYTTVDGLAYFQFDKEEEEKHMKKCHACGQKLPLKAGNVVEFVHTGTHRRMRGVIVNANLSYEAASLVTFDGESLSHPKRLLTRCHGYYRITEREPLG